MVLPPIVRGNNATPSQGRARSCFFDGEKQSNIFIDPTSATGLINSSMSQTNAGSQQQLLKLGETPVARRERRTQEIQRTRLTRNLYH